MEKLTVFLKKHYIKIIIILAAALAVSLGCAFISKSVTNSDNIEARETLKPKKQKKDRETASPELTDAPAKTAAEDKTENTEEALIEETEENEEAYAEPEEYAAEEETVSASDEDRKEYCAIYVSCASINNDITRLKPEKRYLVPSDGVLLPKTKAEIREGDSVFDVLYRTLRENKIHMEFVKTPAYNSVYIEGIGNLYEFDCGSLSGWQYRVNGEFPPYASSEYEVKDGDNIEFLYTCDLGRDIGGYYAAE